MPDSPMPATIRTALIRLTGSDALDLLHRTTTHALRDLAPGDARATLVCDYRGRLKLRFTVARTRDGDVWLISDDTPGPEITAWLERNVFREDVGIDDRSAAIAVSIVPEPPGLARGVVEEHDGAPRRVRVDDGAALVVGPSPSGVGVASERERIAAGRAAHGREIAEAWNPYEVNLAADVHLDKGCYPGQEALQRLVTYDSVRRRLARVRGAGAPPNVPAPLNTADDDGGVVTSAVADGTGWTGLAVVRKAALDEGRSFVLPDGRRVDHVEPLPIARPLGRS